MRNAKNKLVQPAALLIGLFFFSFTMKGVTDCTFTIAATTMTLDANCTTDETLFIPDDFTLDGAGHTITAVDPASGHFLGAVVQNAGATAHVTNLWVTASGLANVCDGAGPPDNRLRGILFNSAEGTISNNWIVGINQGNSGCQEGNAIEVRNPPFDGTHPGTKKVEVFGNYIDDYQKTGIVANGDVDVGVTNNFVGSADLKDFLAANSIQFGFGAFGAVNNNHILGNHWDGLSNFAATAVLIFLAGDVSVSHNTVGGMSTDIGVFPVFSGTINVMNNIIERTVDPNDIKDDFGVGVWFFGNSGDSKVVRNRFDGWKEDFLGADLDRVNDAAFPP